MISLILLVSFVVGVGLLLFGWRGMVLLSEPHCAKCGYDLRASLMANPNEATRRCPECGLDLADRQAVHFGRSAKRPRLMLSGGVLISLPLLVAAVGAMRAWMGLRWDDMRSDASVIDDLKTQAGQPWTWRDLEQRYRAGSLDSQEVAQAIDHLIAYIEAERARTGQEPGPLTWSKDFVALVDRGQSITPEQYLRLCHAYFGPAPRIECHDRVRVGQTIRYSINYGGHWELPGVQFVKALRQVRLSTGEVLPLNSEFAGERAANPDWFSQTGVWGLEGIIKHSLPPGQYELIFDVDAGVLPEKAPLVAIDRKPGQQDRWVTPRQTWSVSVPVKLTVLGADEQVVGTTEDPTMDPTAHFAPTLMARTADRGTGVAIDLDYQYDGKSPVPVSFDVFLRIGETEHKVGGFASSGGRSSYSSDLQLRDGLPPQIVVADVILRPNPKHAEQFPGVKQVWGKPITFESVRIERYDLPAK